MFGVTSDSPLNTYSAGEHLDSRLDSQCGGSSVSFRSYSQVSFTRRMVALSRFIFIAMILSSVPQLLRYPLVATGTRVLLTDPIPGFPFHTRAISALQQRCISSTLATCATRLCLITNFARHRKRHHPSLPSRHLPLSRPRRRKRSSGSSYYHYLCARARHQLSVFGFGLSIERLF